MITGGAKPCQCCGQAPTALNVDLNGVVFWSGCRRCAQRIPELITIVMDKLRGDGKLANKTLEQARSLDPLIKRAPR